MSNTNDNDTQFEALFSNLLKFFFIFAILVVIILAIHFSGFLNFDTPTSSTTGMSIQTIPTTPIETTATPTTATTPGETTEKETTTPEPISTPTQTTTVMTTYPPATVPTASTTIPTTTTLATEPTTQTTSSIPPTPVDPMDISDEAMEKLIEVRYLSIHDDSRPGYKLWSVKNIVVHYVGNPGSTADQNWRNFENNKPSTSAHFIIGLDGEIIQCMPLDEVAWAIGTREGNYTSISIECCHPDETGKFTDATYESLVKLVSWLCKKTGLGRDDVVRHYDYPRQASWGVWHKECPLYYASNSDPESHERWEDFKNDLIIDD